MSEDNLELCPFCGWIPHIYTNEKLGIEFVKCLNCGAVVSFDNYGMTDRGLSVKTMYNIRYENRN